MIEESNKSMSPWWKRDLSGNKWSISRLMEGHTKSGEEQNAKILSYSVNNQKKE